MKQDGLAVAHVVIRNKASENLLKVFGAIHSPGTIRWRSLFWPKRVWKKLNAQVKHNPYSRCPHFNLLVKDCIFQEPVGGVGIGNGGAITNHGEGKLASNVAATVNRHRRIP